MYRVQYVCVQYSAKSQPVRESQICLVSSVGNPHDPGYQLR